MRRVRLIQTFFAAGLNSATIRELIPCMALTPSDDVAAGALVVMQRERARLRAVVAEMNGAIDALDDLITTTATYGAANIE